MIVPCGLQHNPRVTSISAETGRCIDVDQVRANQHQWRVGGRERPGESPSQDGGGRGEVYVYRVRAYANIGGGGGWGGDGLEVEQARGCRYRRGELVSALSRREGAG
eukprot:scaffold4087_cov96-Isochrysis_galbana.AAC.5